MSERNLYRTDDVEHSADFPNPIEHGVIRFTPSDQMSPKVRNQLPHKNDRQFVYVPTGFIRREAETFMDQILRQLQLDLPNIVVVTAEATGTAEEHFDQFTGMSDPSSHPVAKDWTENELKAALKGKLLQRLESLLESSMEVGAWLLPDNPRRVNGAAQIICDLLPTEIGNPSKCVALGLIGLGEEDGDEEFKKVLDGAKTPVGTPSKSAVSLQYDMKWQDGAPLSQLTHFVIFESPEEKNLFRQALLDLVPDFMIAFGNVTEKAMEDMFETVKASSPIVVLEHSGPNIQKMAKLFKHVKHHFHSSDKHGPLRPIEGDDDDLLKFFINTWPINFNQEAVVLCDPLTMKAPLLQKRLLNAISSCFSLKSGGDDIRKTRIKVLQYAWSFHDLAAKHATSKKHRALFIHQFYILFTFLSILSSVAYDRLYGKADSNASQSGIQKFIYLSTILLPLFITSLKQEMDKGAAQANNKAFRMAASKIYSEILKFRTQSGEYRIEEKTEIALQKPIEVFVSRIEKIWLSVKPFLQEDTVNLPGNFWGNGDIDLNKLPPLTSSTTKSTISKENEKLTTMNEKTPLIQEETEDEEDPPEPVFVDDSLSPLKVENYINCRMQTEMEKKSTELEGMVQTNIQFGLVIKMITIFSGGLAAFSLQWTIPVILGVTSALTGLQDYQAYPVRIHGGNEMIVKLNEIKLWWMGLSMYEKQLPQNKDKIILESEKIILNEVKSSFIGMSSKDED